MSRALNPFVALPLLIGFAGCANSPAAVWAMDEQQLKAVPEFSLCDAVALGIDNGRDVRSARREAARRGLSCAGAIAQVVSDCSALRVSPSAMTSDRGQIFDVSNRSGRRLSYRITYQGITSTLFHVPGATRTSVGVEASPLLAASGRSLAALNGYSGVLLSDCHPDP